MPLLVTAAGRKARGLSLSADKNSFAAQKNTAKKIDMQKCGEENCGKLSTSSSPGNRVASRRSGRDGESFFSIEAWNIFIGVSRCARDLEAFSTRSTALHQPSALTLRGGSA
jgi:hypothetical protein